MINYLGLAVLALSGASADSAVRRNLGGLQSANNCCTIYSETDMKGQSHDLCLDPLHNHFGVTSIYTLSDIAIDWQVKSIACTDATSYTACTTHSDGGCWAQVQAHGFRWMSYGDNKDVSDMDLTTVAVSHGMVGKPVTLYQGKDCSGPSMSEPILFDGKNEQKENLQSSFGGLKANADVSELESIRIPSNYAVAMYSDFLDAQQAPFKTIFGEDNQCFTFPKGHLKSLNIYVVDPSAVGRWVRLAQTSQGTTYTYHQGLTSSRETDTQTTMSHSITASMEAGIKFGPFGAKAKVSGNTARSITQGVKTAASVEVTKEFSFPCAPSDDTYGASLYQWEVDNGIVTAFTNVLICRTGEHWTSGPKCPPSACKTRLCEECTDWQED